MTHAVTPTYNSHESSMAHPNSYFIFDWSHSKPCDGVIMGVIYSFTASLTVTYPKKHSHSKQDRHSDMHVANHLIFSSLFHDVEGAKTSIRGVVEREPCLLIFPLHEHAKHIIMIQHPHM
jgi:hypothetical protein